MARVIAPDEFEALYRAVAPELFGYLQRRGVTDPEDLVAEVFTTAWRRRTDLPASALRRAWLFGAARRLLLADHRRAQQERQSAIEAATRPAAPPAEEAAVEDATAAEIVTAALNRLSPADRELIQLVEWERLTPAEVAVALGVRPGTARVRLHRARQALASDPQMQALVARASAAGRALA